MIVIMNNTSCKHYHYSLAGSETWLYMWSPLPGGDALRCLAILLNMCATRRPRETA